jgi:hypothetical protein
MFGMLGVALVLLLVAARSGRSGARPRAKDDSFRT